MDVIMPQLGETVAEGTVTRWYKKVGDTVKADDVLFDVETDKVSTEIPAQADGVLAEILVAEGVTVLVSTSYMDEAERCDRVAMLHEGRLLALDTPNQLRASLGGVMLALHADSGRGASGSNARQGLNLPRGRDVSFANRDRLAWPRDESFQGHSTDHQQRRWRCHEHTDT